MPIPTAAMGSALLWALTVFLSIAVAAPYTRGSNVNEVHFFGLADLRFDCCPSGGPIVSVQQNDHFHVYSFMHPVRKAPDINPALAYQQLHSMLAAGITLSDIELVASGIVVEFQGTSPPLDEYHTPSGLSPPSQFLS